MTSAGVRPVPSAPAKRTFAPMPDLREPATRSLVESVLQRDFSDLRLGMVTAASPFGSDQSFGNRAESYALDPHRPVHSRNVRPPFEMHPVLAPGAFTPTTGERAQPLRSAESRPTDRVQTSKRDQALARAMPNRHNLAQRLRTELLATLPRQAHARDMVQAEPLTNPLAPFAQRAGDTAANAQRFAANSSARRAFVPTSDLWTAAMLPTIAPDDDSESADPSAQVQPRARAEAFREEGFAFESPVWGRTMARPRPSPFPRCVFFVTYGPSLLSGRTAERSAVAAFCASPGNHACGGDRNPCPAVGAIYTDIAPNHDDTARAARKTGGSPHACSRTARSKYGGSTPPSPLCENFAPDTHSLCVIAGQGHTSAHAP